MQEFTQSSLKVVPQNRPYFCSITSGKGGVGKSHTTANLAIALNNLGKKILIVDGDWGLANLNIIFGVNYNFDIYDVLTKNCSIEDIVIPITKSIHIVPATSGNTEMTNLSDNLRHFISEQISHIAKNYDYVLIDTEAGINSNSMYFCAKSSQVIVVATSEPTSLADSYAVIKVLNQKYRKKDFLLLANCASTTNNIHGNSEASRIYEKLSNTTTKYLNINLKFLGGIPYDSLVGECLLKGKPILSRYPGSRLSKSFKKVALRVDTISKSLHLKR